MQRHLLSILFLTGLSIATSSCAIRKPCSEGGDTSWEPKIIGDKECVQKKDTDGKLVNDGKFRQAYQKTGTIALEGQFLKGQKQGIWAFYDESGKLKAVKYFERGIEKAPPPEVQKEVDRLIEQKAGHR